MTAASTAATSTPIPLCMLILWVPAPPAPQSVLRHHGQHPALLGRTTLIRAMKKLPRWPASASCSQLPSNPSKYSAHKPHPSMIGSTLDHRVSFSWRRTMVPSKTFMGFPLFIPGIVIVFGAGTGCSLVQPIRAVAAKMLLFCFMG